MKAIMKKSLEDKILEHALQNPEEEAFGRLYGRRNYYGEYIVEICNAETVEEFDLEHDGDSDVVGLYRSHPEYGMFISEGDRQIYSTYPPNSVFMAIDPHGVGESIYRFLIIEDEEVIEIGNEVIL